MKTKDQIEEMAEKYKLEFTKCPDQIALEQLIKTPEGMSLVVNGNHRKTGFKAGYEQAQKDAQEEINKAYRLYFNMQKHAADVKVDYVKLIRFSDDTYTWIADHHVSEFPMVSSYAVARGYWVLKIAKSEIKTAITILRMKQNQVALFDGKHKLFLYTQHVTIPKNNDDDNV